MKLLILHLSDIHVRTLSDVILARASNIAACLFKCLPDSDHVFIIVSGDVAFSGEADQYDVARSFLAEVRRLVQAEKDVPVDILIAPGNHDCDFAKDSNARRIMLDSLASMDPLIVDQSIVALCTAPQAAF